MFRVTLKEIPKDEWNIKGKMVCSVCGHKTSAKNLNYESSRRLVKRFKVQPTLKSLKEKFRKQQRRAKYKRRVPRNLKGGLLKAWYIREVESFKEDAKRTRLYNKRRARGKKLAEQRKAKIEKWRKFYKKHHGERE